MTRPTRAVRLTRLSVMVLTLLLAVGPTGCGGVPSAPVSDTKPGEGHGPLPPEVQYDPATAAGLQSPSRPTHLTPTRKR
jgi:hypothetical protein